MARRTKRTSRSRAADGSNEEWLAGFRIGLALADRGMGGLLGRADRVEVFDGAGERILSCRVADLQEVVR